MLLAHGTTPQHATPTPPRHDTTLPQLILFIAIQLRHTRSSLNDHTTFTPHLDEHATSHHNNHHHHHIKIASRYGKTEPQHSHLPHHRIARRLSAPRHARGTPVKSCRPPSCRGGSFASSVVGGVAGDVGDNDDGGGTSPRRRFFRSDGAAFDSAVAPPMRRANVRLVLAFSMHRQ